MNSVTVHQGTQHALLAPALAESAQPMRLFEPANPSLQAQPVSQGGRNAAWFIRLPNGQEGVLRRYRRGGAMAKLVRQRYLWLGAEATRSWAEYRIMLQLSNKLDVVPAPLGALYQRHGLSYEAALIVQRIPQAVPLANRLDQADPNAVAAAVLKIHEAGVWHADLNAYNVLLDAAQHVWIIDFDRAKRCSMHAKHRQQNLLRLRRSLVKVQGEEGLGWWEVFNQAYLQQWGEILTHRA